MTGKQSESVTPRKDNDEVSQLVAVQLEVATQRDVARVSELEAKIAGALRASRSEATLRAYRSDVADFKIWAQGEGLAWLPAEPATVAAYLAEMAHPPDDRAPMAVATIERRKAAIGEAHKHAGYDNPCANPLVKQVTKGLRRQLGVAPKNRKIGISTADVKAIVDDLDMTRTIDVRDKALLLVGYATAMRRAELVALSVVDVENHPEGLLVWRRRSKTDQESVGHRIEVAYGEHPTTCPVRAFREWIDAAGIVEGPVFRRVYKNGKIGDRALSDRSVATVVKKLVGRLGHDSAEYAGHSLRRGFATETSRNGASERTIAATTGHTSARGLQPYIADAGIMEDPPSRYLGL